MTFILFLHINLCGILSMFCLCIFGISVCCATSLSGLARLHHNFEQVGVSSIMGAYCSVHVMVDIVYIRVRIANLNDII